MKFRIIWSLIALAILTGIFVYEQNNSSSPPPVDNGGISIQP